MAIDPIIKKKADDIRNKVYGKEVRESLASGLEEMSSDVVENEGRQSVVEGRQDSVESQWQAVSDEMTDKDVISAPEIIAARNGEANLKTRLDEEHQEVTTQLAHNAKDLLNTQNKHKPKTIKPMVVFTFDDGTTYDLQILELFNNKGIVGTTAITLNDIGRQSYYLKTEQIKLFKDSGWEIASHSKTGSFSDIRTLTDEQLDIELKDSKQGLIDLGFDVKNFLVPYGFIDDRVSKMAAKYYRSTRTSGGGNLSSHNITPINTFRLNSYLIGESANSMLSDWKTQVDNCVDNNTLLIFIGHSNKIVENSKVADIGDLIDYVKSKGIEITTMDKALDVFENQVDTDLMKIGANGKVGGQYGKIRHAPTDTILGNTPFSDIEPVQTTVNVVTAGNSAGFPAVQGGTLITFKPDNVPTRTLQIAKSNASNTVWTRGFDSSGVASNWEKITDSVVTLTYDSVNATSPLTEFPSGISFVQVTQGNSTGMPTVQGYLLETKKPATSNGYNVQLAHIYNATATYKRTWTSSNEWTSWVQLNE